MAEPKRSALLVATTGYTDRSLAGLLAPEADVSQLGQLLENEEIGRFDRVDALLNAPESAVRERICEFFDNRSRDDLLLLYFSGHGLLDRDGRLFLAATNTKRANLRGTALPVSLVQEAMDACRSGKQIVILDCCHSGAFGRGTKGEGVNVRERLKGDGSARIVLTATDAVQFAWEGDQIIGDTRASLFTHYLIEGMRTGAADEDHDGEITVQELFHYANAEIRSRTTTQTPQMWSFAETGRLVIARSPVSKPQPSAIPAEVHEIVRSVFPEQRVAAVEILERFALDSHRGRALAAIQILRELGDEDDSLRVRDRASQALTRAGVTPTSSVAASDATMMSAAPKISSRPPTVPESVASDADCDATLRSALTSAPPHGQRGASSTRRAGMDSAIPSRNYTAAGAPKPGAASALPRKNHSQKRGALAVPLAILALTLVALAAAWPTPKGTQPKDPEHATAKTDAPGFIDDVERFKIPVSGGQPTKGPEDALVTLVQIADFQCPFCSRVEPTIAQLIQDYKGEVRVVWRNNPLSFHQNAMPAAEFAMEAFAQGGSEMFWKAHDLLFANQQKLERANLDAYARELGLDMTKYRNAMDNHTHKAAIETDQQLAGKFEARGTPAFFINGRSLLGAQPLDAFKTMIDDELARADKLVKSGIAKNQVYAVLTKNAKTEKSADAQQLRRVPDPKAVFHVPVGSSPVKGPSDALVTIVEFGDFQCPFCARVEPTLEQIVDTYGKDARLVFKQNPLPFHQNAALAAEASLEARDQGKFWQMHEKLFANQQALEKDKLEGYAKELGLNVAKFKTALETNKHKAEIDADQKLVRELGASGTPSFFINGRSVRGAQPFDAFKTVIDEELAKAKQLVASGTPKVQLYGKVIENGATTPRFVDAPSALPPSGAAVADANKIHKLAEAPDAPVKGNPNAKVVIEQFSDFQCPFCARVEPTIKKIEEQYGDKVKIVWRDYPLPFHQNAMPAAEAAREVLAQGGNAKFWKYHDLLFANQRALSRADLERYAEQVGGINMAKFKAALDSNKHKAAVQADMDAVANAGARIGTPSFFINGKLLQGAQPFEVFRTAIDAALAPARLN